MNRELVMSFEDILAHPHHYISELILNDGDSFLLYQYGPFLAVNHPEIIGKYRRTDFKNEIFLLMRDIATIFNISESVMEIKLAKAKLLDLLNACKANQYTYSDKVCSIVVGVLEDIRKHQYSTKSLESAMLNYSPIVGYMGTIVKPDLSTTINFIPEKMNTTDEHLMQKFKEIFIKNPLLIIKYNEVFLNLDYLIKQPLESREKNVPSDIIPFLAIENNDVRLYFIFIYLRYFVSPSARYGIIKKIENISSVYNRTHNGDVIDIKNALEAFSYIEFTEDDLLKLDI